MQICGMGGRRSLRQFHPFVAVGLGAATENEALLLGNDFRKKKKRVYGSFCGKEKGKRNKVEGKWRRERDRRQERAEKLIKMEMLKSFSQKKMPGKGSAGLPGSMVPHLYTSLHKLYGQESSLEHNPHFTAPLCTNKTSTCKIRSKLFNQSTESIKWH